MATNATMAYATQLKGLLAKADGKDKFIALIQYAAMFTSGGEAGYALAVQKSFSAARKPFRIYKVRPIAPRMYITRHHDITRTPHRSSTLLSPSLRTLHRLLFPFPPSPPFDASFRRTTMSTFFSTILSCFSPL